MKYLKLYQKFFEDGEGGGVACSNASNTAGMGAVVAAQVGPLPGVPGTSGSGDVGFGLGGVQTKAPIDSFNGKKEKKRKKKGKPSQVSDLRDLEEVSTSESLGWEEPSNDNTFDSATKCVKLYYWLCNDKVDKELLDKGIEEITGGEGWYSLDDETLNELIDFLENYNK
jgi:hypothetical protein